MPARTLISRLSPWIFIFFIGLIGGLSYSFAKIAVDGGFSPLGITLFEAIFSAALLYVLCIFRGKPLKVIITNIKLIAVLAVIGIAISGPVFYIAAGHLQAGILAITAAFVPMITYGASIPFGFEKFNTVRMTGLVMGVIAILLITLPESSLPEKSAIFWILFVMISVLCDSAETIILGIRSAVKLGPIRLALGMSLAGILMLGPIVYWTDSFAWPSLAMTEADLALIGLGLITVIDYTMFIYAVNRFGSVFASQAGYTVTLSGVLWGIAIFGESHSLWVWGALATMIIGLMLVKPREDEQLAGTES
jgi:drug/metabolite transporter (DMT)-like permease